MAPQLNNARERGQIMVVSIVVLMLMGAFGVTMIDSVTSAKNEGTAAAQHQHRLFMAESGLDLSAVVPGAYRLVCLPLKIVGGDGAPARAILIG